MPEQGPSGLIQNYDLYKLERQMTQMHVGMNGGDIQGVYSPHNIPQHQAHVPACFMSDESRHQYEHCRTAKPNFLWARSQGHALNNTCGGRSLGSVFYLLPQVKWKQSQPMKEDVVNVTSSLTG